MKRKEKGPVVYVGPGYRDTELSTFKIYADGIPKKFEDHPIYKHLFVRPDKLDEARKEILKPGSSMRFYFQKAVEEHEKKGGN